MTIIYFLLMMIPIVIIHELGHFYIGKWSGIKPEVFSVGFGPELWSKVAKDGTKWRVAAFPLGGYVKFADDANGTNFPNLDTSKPSYLARFGAKIATLLAGPFANFLLSMILFFIYATSFGLQSDQATLQKIHFVENEIVAGDKIIAVDGTYVKNIEDVYTATENIQSPNVDAKVERNGAELVMTLPNPYRAIVVGVDPKMPAFKAGIRPGDEIVKFADVDIYNFKQVIDTIDGRGLEPIDVSVIREGAPMTLTLTPIASDDPETLGQPRMGVQFGGFYETAHERLGPVDASKYAVSSTIWILTASFEGIRDLVTGKVGLDAMSGPVGIGRMAADSAENGFWNFVFMMGMMSSAIGFLNLLPLPILDGGHLVIMVYEKIIGKLPPQKLLNGLFALGFALLLGLMLVTTVRDLFG